MSLINIVQLNLKQFENILQKPVSLKVKVYFFFEVYYIHSVPYAHALRAQFLKLYQGENAHRLKNYLAHEFTPSIK